MNKTIMRIDIFSRIARLLKNITTERKNLKAPEHWESDVYCRHNASAYKDFVGIP